MLADASEDGLNRSVRQWPCCLEKCFRVLFKQRLCSDARLLQAPPVAKARDWSLIRVLGCGTGRASSGQCSGASTVCAVACLGFGDPGWKKI